MFLPLTSVPGESIWKLNCQFVALIFSVCKPSPQTAFCCTHKHTHMNAKWINRAPNRWNCSNVQSYVNLFMVDSAVWTALGQWKNSFASLPDSGTCQDVKIITSILTSHLLVIVIKVCKHTQTRTVTHIYNKVLSTRREPHKSFNCYINHCNGACAGA